MMGAKMVRGTDLSLVSKSKYNVYINAVKNTFRKGTLMTVRAAETIYNLVLNDIIGGHMRPGDNLAEIALSEKFDVSRTPVREALHRLEQENLIERGPRRAYVVRKMQANDFEDLFEAVGEVEASLAALAAQRMSEMQRRQLVMILTEGKDCGDDTAAYSHINTRFHALINQGANNEILNATHASLTMRTQAWRVANFRRDARRLETSRVEHGSITEAILDADANATRKLMREHVASSFLTLANLLSQGE